MTEKEPSHAPDQAENQQPKRQQQVANTRQADSAYKADLDGVTQERPVHLSDLFGKATQANGLGRTVIETQLQVTRHSGPLPPPEVIEAYEKVSPGAAATIIAMAEREQAHRHDMEKTALNGAIERDKRGQRIGGIAVILALLVAFVLGYFGHTGLAGTIATTTLIGIAAIFVLGRLPWLNKDDDQDDSGRENTEESEK